MQTECSTAQIMKNRRSTTMSESTFTGSSYYDNNIVTLVGKIISPPELSHEIYGEKYYSTQLAVSRLSEKMDYIPITISERLFGEYYPTPNDHVKIIGQYRSYNNYSGVGNRLILTVFVKEILYISEADEEDFEKSKSMSNVNPNQIYLNGFICKEPTYRTTPFNREISDVLLAVNRSYKKSDYIPCIAWGRNAKYVQSLSVGTNIKVWGRIQSREYQKHISETEVVNKTAYEVSISKLEIVE